jgi:hypothetical protein
VVGQECVGFRHILKRHPKVDVVGKPYPCRSLVGFHGSLMGFQTPSRSLVGFHTLVRSEVPYGNLARLFGLGGTCGSVSRMIHGGSSDTCRWNLPRRSLCSLIYYYMLQVPSRIAGWTNIGEKGPVRATFST